MPTVTPTTMPAISPVPSIGDPGPAVGNTVTAPVEVLLDAEVEDVVRAEVVVPPVVTGGDTSVEVDVTVTVVTGCV